MKPPLPLKLPIRLDRVPEGPEGGMVWEYLDANNRDVSMGEVVAALNAAAEREAKLREALEQINDPIKHLRDLAEKEGKRLDGHMAIQLAESPNYLRGIARDALASLALSIPLNEQEDKT